MLSETEELLLLSPVLSLLQAAIMQMDALMSIARTREANFLKLVIVFLLL
jgi:hypothetical protein